MYKIINKKKLFATIIADLIGSIIFLPKTILKRNEEINPEEIREILIIRTAYIGDVVMTIPMLKPLKERYPDSEISFCTSTRASEVLKNNPYIDEIITYNPFWFYSTSKKEYIGFIKKLKERSFNLVIEARGDIREFLFLIWPLKAKFKISYDVGGGGYLLTHVVPYKELKHKVTYHLDIAEYLGCDTTNDIEWDIYLSEEENRQIALLLTEEGINETATIVALHPGGRKELKCWTPEGYAAVADIIMNDFGCTVLLTGSSEEVPLVEEVGGIMRNKPIMLAGKTTIRILAGVFRRCSMVICNDSSPMHIAAAVKTFVVAIFGPSKSNETGPYGEGHIVVEKDFPCRYKCDENVCHFRNYNQCMKDISKDDVISAVEKVFRQL